MSERIRHIVLGTMTIVILGVANWQIVGKENIVQQGATILLQLAPVDPRSLMQGDYMALRYRMTTEIDRAAREAGISDGVVVVHLDESGIAEFVALYQGGKLEPGQALLKFRKRGDSVRIASDAFFFEEGRFEMYRRAGFGEIRVDDNGNAVLTGLRDQEVQPLGAPLHQIN
jgi:uncharacterized membrane-anchored protein